MSDDRPPDVLSSLPHRRPHRRSEKRGPRPASDPAPPTAAGQKHGQPRARRAQAEPIPQPAQPEGVPPTPRTRKPAPAAGTDIFQTAVQAAAELAEIGLSASARALRGALSRLPHP